MEQTLSVLIQNQKCICCEKQINKHPVSSDENSEDELNTSVETVISEEPLKKTVGKKKNYYRRDKKHKQQRTRSLSKDSTGNFKNRIIIGNAEPGPATHEVNFSAATKKAWIYFGRVKRGTTCENVTSFLTNKYKGKQFEVKDLPGNQDARSTSFKVGADLDLLEHLYKSDNWPAGVLVKKFNFRFFRKPAVGNFE
ncbi:hypothetical protein Zmor_026902 [Zophobas morio]|uniref:Uncharacterized protein n=1 Tax=Zophobas morio TaxID=2755281 RepID=A0AA38HXX8_9CUCU|nr:hypothetical protein Zmor_026902 [Zophobas morio]